MSHQLALNIIARIKPNQVEALKAQLGTINEPANKGPIAPFAELDTVHFARVIVFDVAADLEGNPLPPQLALLSNYDAPQDQHLQQLSTVGGAWLDSIFKFCENYPEPGASNPAHRATFLRAHSQKSKVDYVNCQGRTVRQIRAENELRQAINHFLDSRDFTQQTALHVRQVIIDYVAGRNDLSWALQPPAQPSLAWRIKESVHRIGIALAVILASPLLLLGLPIFLWLLRRHEQSDQADTSQASAESIQAFRADEDYWVHNQIVAVGLFKPGWFRYGTARVILALTDYATRHIYNSGVLSGLNTIHFARWVLLDDGKRLFFSSNYDGSLESYMNDFIDKAAWGLNAIFSNGEGFPRTSFLFCGGIRDEKAYKRFLPTRQVHSRLWYSAYPHLTTKNIANNTAIRIGLSGSMTEQQAQYWLQRFGVGNELPNSGRIARFLDSIRWDKVCKHCS